MLRKKEILFIFAVSIVLGFTLSLLVSFKIFLITSLFVFLVILINIFAKKLIAYYYDTGIEHKLWEVKRYWCRKHDCFENAIPAGFLIPILVTGLSLGYINWMGALVFEPETKIYKSAKRRGEYKYSALTEFHLASIAAAGIIANLIIGIISYSLGHYNFASLNIFYAFFNLFPLSDLDGNKIFFGNQVLWFFLSAVALFFLLIFILI